jgi:hypothetical protein
MGSLPIIHILFWIAVNLAPQNTSQIVITASEPYKTWTWTRQESGWLHSVERSVWKAEGSTVTSKSGEKAEEKYDVGRLHKGIKEHDWDKSPSLKLEWMGSLTKKGDTFVCNLSEGGPKEKRFIIEFKKK